MYGSLPDLIFKVMSDLGSTIQHHVPSFSFSSSNLRSSSSPTTYLGYGPYWTSTIYPIEGGLELPDELLKAAELLYPRVCSATARIGQRRQGTSWRRRESRFSRRESSGKLSNMNFNGITVMIYSLYFIGKIDG
jgi:hypothetical protein